MITQLATINNNAILFQDETSSVQNNSENNNEIKMFEQDENGKLHMTDAGKIALIIGGIYIAGECLDGLEKEDKEILEELNEDSEEQEKSKDKPKNKTSFGEVVIELLLAWVANVAHKMEAEK